MDTTEKLLAMLTDKKASRRYDACEWLRISQTSSPEVIRALQKAALDEDQEVAARAKLALEADVHHRMMVKMRLVEPDEMESTTDSIQDSIDDAIELVAVEGEVVETQGLNPKEAESRTKLPVDTASMLSSLRAWGMWCLGLGILNMVMSGIFNSPHGIVLVLTGLAAFIFRSASMFIVYGISLAWAVIWTFVDALYVKQAYWFIVAGFQLFLSILVFTDYRRFRKMELEPLEPLDPLELPIDPIATSGSSNRAARFFPRLGSCLGCSSIIGLIMFFFVIAYNLYSSNYSASPPTYYNFFFELVMSIGVLGFAFGLASLLSKYRRKGLSIVALISGMITTLLMIIFIFLGSAT